MHIELSEAQRELNKASELESVRRTAMLYVNGAIAAEREAYRLRKLLYGQADPRALVAMLERFESEVSNGSEGSAEAFYVCTWAPAAEMALLRELVATLKSIP